MKNLFIIRSFQKTMAFLGLLYYLFLVSSSGVRGQDSRSVAKPITTSNKRLALVIGNSAYSVKPLPNARNDAQDVAATLRSLGFEVILKENLSKDDMVTTISDFSRRLRNYAVGLFYFAGHGFMSTQKDNFLMSIGVKEDMTEAFAKSNSIALEDVMGSMEEAHNTPTKILIVDACRNNPYRSWGRSDQKGLGSVTTPDGLIAFFAASPNEEANENKGKRNGLFTQELLTQLKTPNLSFDDLIRNTTNAVKRQNPSQRPYRVGDLSDVFYFNPKGTPPPPPPTRDLPPFMEMVRIPGGTFEMGSTEGEADEKPTHTVTVSGFMMGKYEVTVGQFAQFVSETNYKTDAEKQGSSRYWNPDTQIWKDTTGINWRYGANLQKLSANDYTHPVVHVSHNDAIAFCDWLSRKEGKTYRLPTEAQWEYAAGNGSKHNKYSWGSSDPTKAVANIVDEQFQRTFSKTNWKKFSNYNDGYVYTAPVGSFEANAFGLHDMTGNVLEWCSDWYASDWYAQAAASEPNPENKDFGSKTYRVLRGGSWINSPDNARVADRDFGTPGYRFNYGGFRLVSQFQ